MSTEPPQNPDWEPSDALDDRLTDPERLEFPDGWTTSGSWDRVTEEGAKINALNEAEWMVWMENSDTPKRVLFALEDDHLKAECACEAWKYHNFCVHVGACWWYWSQGRLVVSHLDTGRDYDWPPAWLQFGHQRTQSDGFDGLTTAELDAYLTCDLGPTGVREYARKTDRAAGTVGNLLGRAREKVGGQR